MTDIKTLIEARRDAAAHLAALDAQIDATKAELKSALAALSGKAVDPGKPKKDTAPRGSVEKAVKNFVSQGVTNAEEISKAAGLNLGSVRSALRKIVKDGVKVEMPAPPADDEDAVAPAGV